MLYFLTLVQSIPHYDLGRLTSYILEGYSYGKLLPGSSTQWTGMVGELQSGRADLTVSELSVVEERNLVISYTQPVLSSR